MYIQKVPKPKDAVRINSEQDIPDFLKDTIRIEGDKIISLAAEGYNEAPLGSVIGFDRHAPTETGKGAWPLGADSIVEKDGVFYPAPEVRTAKMIEGPFELDTEWGKQTLDEGKGLLVTRPNGDQNILNLDTSSADDYMLCTDSGENVGTLKQLSEPVDMSVEEAFKIVVKDYPNLPQENGKEAYIRLAQAEMDGYKMPPAKELQEAHDALSTPEKLIVHGGMFHADDVLTAAVLRELNPDLTIERAFVPPKDRDSKTLIADMGGGRFDHHNKKEEDMEKRDDAKPYAAIGLVLRDFEDRIFPNGIPKQLQDDIRRIEDADNGLGNGNFHVISSLVHYMNPQWDSKENPNNAFENAVQFVQDNYIEPYMEKGYLTEKEQEMLDKRCEELKQSFEESKEKAKDIVLDAMNNIPEGVANGVVVLPQYAPWNDVVCEDPDAKFVIFPSNRGGYNLQAVPPQPESFEKRIPLPEEWLAEKPEGASFVHQGLFIAAFDTREHAIEAVNDIMRTYEQQKENVLDNIEQGLSLEDVPKEFQNDIDVVIAAVRNDPDEIQFAADFLKENPEVLEAVNESNGPGDDSDPGKKNRFDFEMDR